MPRTRPPRRSIACIRGSFSTEVHRVLVPDGVMSFSLSGYEGYISKELARLIAVADRTLRKPLKMC